MGRDGVKKRDGVLPTPFTILRDERWSRSAALYPQAAGLQEWAVGSHSPRSRMSPPPSDLELGALDLRKLKRLAGAMNLAEQLESWLRHLGPT